MSQLLYIPLSSQYQENPEEAIQACQALLDEPKLDTAVRIGDVYGMMVEHYASDRKYEEVMWLDIIPPPAAR